MNIVHLDYETRSRSDLSEVGAHRYAEDPSTRILMAGVSRDGSDDVKLWVDPEFGDPGENDAAMEMLVTADLIYAHNATFEQAMTWGRGQKDMGLKIPISKWRCTAAMARKAGLPAKLELVAQALGLDQQKDPRGKALIKFFSVPQKDGTFNDPQKFPTEFGEFMAYCVQDVRTEKAVHRKLKAFELQGDPLETFLFDLRLNQRGIPVNVPALQNAQGIIEETEKIVTVQFQKLTGLNPTQRMKILALVQGLGSGITDMQADTVEAETHRLSDYEKFAAEEGRELNDKTVKLLQVLTLYKTVQFAAAKKVTTMLACACTDGRVRGGHQYYGAGTGRWSGKLVQPQNFKKTPGWMKKMTGQIFDAICHGATAQELSVVYGEPLEVIAGVIRHFIGKGAKRDFGKVVELACQFGLGTEGFMRTCAKWNIPCDVDLAHRAVHEYYRPTHRKIVARWYLMSDWMHEAYANPGVEHGPFTVRTIAGIKYLLLKLPSGRSLAYPHIEINKREPTNEELKEMQNGKSYPERRFLEITFWGQLPNSTQWGRLKLHGALAFQNEVQGIAADCMAAGAINAEKRGYAPFMLVHDQALAEMRMGITNAEDYAFHLTQMPPWAKGLPLKAEAKITPYYTK